MYAQLSDDAQELGCATGLEPCNVGEDDAVASSVVDMLEPGREPRDVFFDLLDEGQVVGELRQALVRLDARLIDGESAGGDENRIERIILGPAQVHTRIGPDLDRLQDQDGDALLPQMSDNAAFIAAGRFD